MEAQTQTYTLAKQGKLLTFISKTDSIAFPAYKKVDRKTSESAVTINDASYKFIIKDTKHGRIQDILDASGNRLATVFLSGINENNVVFGDGTQLKWMRTGKTSWGYFIGDKEVVKSFYYFEDKNKKFVIQKYDSTIVSAVFPAISMEYGTKNSRNTPSSKRTVGTMFAVAGMLSVIRLLMDTDNDN
jgi:hypothetical protein